MTISAYNTELEDVKSRSCLECFGSGYTTVDIYDERQYVCRACNGSGYAAGNGQQVKDTAP